MADKEKLGNFTPEDAPEYEAVLQCMRCGFCLPTCPTFALTGRERSSPRGRVALARAVAEGKLEFTE
ncbi:MAG: 4Fe-4S ferredoxin, partial [Candidatus Zixiibacteriota bacterium]